MVGDVECFTKSFFAATTFSPPRRGCEGEGAGASLVEDEMAHVFVIGAAAGAVGSIVGASANRDARARAPHPLAFSLRLSARPPLGNAKTEWSPTAASGDHDDASRAVVVFGMAPERVSRTPSPPRRVADRVRAPAASRPRRFLPPVPKTPPSSGNKQRQSKSRRRLARTSPTRTAFTTLRPPRSSPSAKPRRRLASPASRRCSRSSPRSSRRRSKKPRRA